MLYLGNKILLAIGYKGIFLFIFNENYKSYNIMFQINKNIKLHNMTKSYVYCLI